MPRKRDPNAPKLSSFERLKRSWGKYDPEKEGYGDPTQWRDAFNRIMGEDEANCVLAGDSPLTILGFTAMPSLSELKVRYRELVLQHHPDKGGTHEQAQKIIAAYSALKAKV